MIWTAKMNGQRKTGRILKESKATRKKTMRWKKMTRVKVSSSVTVIYLFVNTTLAKIIILMKIGNLKRSGSVVKK